MDYVFNPHGIPALTACICLLFVGTFVYYKDKRNKINRTFLLFCIVLSFFPLGEFFVRCSNAIEIVLFWARFSYFGIIFSPAILFHFSLIFPKDHKYYIKKKSILIIVYLLCLVSFITFNVFLSINHLNISPWGYRLPFNEDFVLIMLLDMTLFILAVFNLFLSYKNCISYIHRRQLLHLFYGGIIVILFSISTNAFPPFLGLKLYPLSTLSFILFTLFVGAAILKYNLLTFKPMVEPLMETKAFNKKKYNLKKGWNYIIKERKIEKSYKIFQDQLIHDIQGLCITKLPPEQIRKKYNLKKTPIIWITFKESENTITPKKIDAIKLQILDFTSKTKKSCILMDCFGEIIMVNGFEKTVYFLIQIKKICEENNSNLLISINPEMFEEKQILILEKEFLNSTSTHLQQ